jgi:hypothetical protein
MRNISTLLFILLASISHSAFSQKVKYKDIFPLLEKKQYEAAEPLLKQYLEKEKNNPNATLYMGIVKMEKYFKLKNTDPEGAKLAKTDAIRFLKQAQLEINDWEVSKNEKYYSYYKRRNVRSGEIEVSVSDITYDIESRIKKLTEAQ